MAEALDKTSSLQEIITCSICLEVLNKPVIFPCIHHFCKTCKEQLKKETQGGVTGILCPLCQQFTSDEAIKDDFVMAQIINVYTKNSSGENAEVYCDFCNKEKSTHTCLECKSTLCGSCKNAHTRIPSCKGHTIKPLDDTEVAVFDSVVFCSIHTDKMVEFNCEDCNKALCYRCKILDHDGHRTQTIEGAIASMLPIVKKKQEPIQKDITYLTQCIANLNDNEAAMMHRQEKLVLAIENKQVQLQIKLELDSVRLDTEVKKTFQAKIKEIQMQRYDLGHMLSSKESITSRVDTLLNHLKDVHLLLQLQGDLMTTLDHHQESCDKITLVPSLNKDLQYVHHEDNIVATFKDENEKVVHMHEKIEALEMENKKLVQNKQQDHKEIQLLRNEMEAGKQNLSKLSQELKAEKQQFLVNLELKDDQISWQVKQKQILEAEKQKDAQNEQHYGEEIQRLRIELHAGEQTLSKLSKDLATEKGISLHNLKQKDNKIFQQQTQIQRLEENQKELAKQRHEYELEHAHNKQQYGEEILHLRNKLQAGEQTLSKLSEELATEKGISLHNLKQRDHKIFQQSTQIQSLDVNQKVLAKQRRKYELAMDNKVKKMTDMTQQRNVLLGECKHALNRQQPQMSSQMSPHPKAFNQGNHGTLIQRIRELINEHIDF